MRPHTFSPLYGLFLGLVGALAPPEAPAQTLPRAAAAPTHVWAAEAWTGIGAGPRIEALGLPVTGATTLLGAEAYYGRRATPVLTVGVGVGGTYLRRGGSVGPDGYRAAAWRATLTPALDLAVTEAWTVDAGAEVRTAADLVDFHARADRNVRTRLLLRVRRRIGHHLDAVLAVAEGFPRRREGRADVTHFLDPARSARLGLLYRLRAS